MPKRLHLAIGDEAWTAQVAGSSVNLNPGDRSVTIARDGERLTAEAGAWSFSGRAILDADTVWVTIAGEVFAVRVRHGAGQIGKASTDRNAFMAPMSATVIRIAVAPGDAVRDGDVLISLEAMKMELPIRAPRDGVVRAIHCREGDLVQPDQVLLDFD
jgi:3-methylcrotonyl-CoA carboxylase alpha subunit